MSETNVVILSNGSVFVESIASRLRQQLTAKQVQTIDNRQADVLDQIVAAQPSIVIAEMTDAKLEPTCAFSRLLMALPQLTLIRLDLQQETLHVVTSEQRPVGGMTGLLRAIRSARGYRSQRRVARRAALRQGPKMRKEPKAETD